MAYETTDVRGRRVWRELKRLLIKKRDRNLRAG
jgi:hypothetical protein